MGVFKKIVEALRQTREAMRRKFDALLSGGELTDEFYEELEDVLISSDVGFEASEEIIQELREYARKNKIRNSEDVRTALKIVVATMFEQKNNEKYNTEFKYPCVITVIGVNGVGKTTTIGKMAHYFKKQGKDVCLVAGDTFRAAASEQLNEWAKRSKVRIVKQSEGADAAAVVFDGIASAKAKNTDVLLIDTAGRLHTKDNLMHELGKINRVIDKEYPNVKRYNLIVIDATTGQNAINQIVEFNKQFELDGIVLTKLDGTAKGGIVISLMREFNLPVYFVGVGEGIDDLETFSPQDFANNLF